MNTARVHALMSREIAALRHDADRFAVRVRDKTVDTSILQSGIRKNGFDVRRALIRLAWDASGTVDIPAKAAADRYDLSVAEFAERGIDVSRLVAAPAGVLTERSRVALVDLFRTDMKDPALDVAARLLDLKASLKAAVDYADLKYPVGPNGEDLGRVIDARRKSVAIIYSAGELAPLEALLLDVSAKCTALVPR